MTTQTQAEETVKAVEPDPVREELEAAKAQIAEYEKALEAAHARCAELEVSGGGDGGNDSTSAAQ